MYYNNNKRVLCCCFYFVLNRFIILEIWIIFRGLCDICQSGKLNQEQFALSMWLIKQKLRGNDIPTSLTPDMIPPSLRKMSEGAVVSRLQKNIIDKYFWYDWCRTFDTRNNESLRHVDIFVEVSAWCSVCDLQTLSKILLALPTLSRFLRSLKRDGPFSIQFLGSLPALWSLRDRFLASNWNLKICYFIVWCAGIL